MTLAKQKRLLNRIIKMENKLDELKSEYNMMIVNDDFGGDMGKMAEHMSKVHP